jgi:GDP-L-fucose synthase
MAAASVFVMQLDKATFDEQTEPMQNHINVGYGDDVTIADLAKAVGNVVGYQGMISFDTSKPDGTPRKWMDSRRLNQLGWKPLIDLNAGLSEAYADFLLQAKSSVRS